ncbi:DUF1800 domain-containing protein [Thiolapillus sp.]
MDSPIHNTDRRAFLKFSGSAGVGLAAYSNLSTAAAVESAGWQPAMYRANPLRSAASTLTPLPPLAAMTLNRAAFGVAPGDIEDFNARGASDLARLTSWVDEQLDPQSIDDSDLESRLANPAFRTLNKSLTQLWTDHYRPENITWEERVRPAWEILYATMTRAIYSKRQLHEVMVDFWHNHFNVYAYETPNASVWVHYDRDVIRPHAFGNFRQMLEANAKSTAMLYYLDNVDSSDEGPNENYARELLELHTLGAENYLGIMNQWDVPKDSQGRPIGYVDGDVLEVARCFTGWTVANGHWSDPSDPDTGEFYYRDFWHDRFQKYVLGEFIPADQAALQDGLRVLDKLAEHPGTANYICRKLIRRLITDEPPESLVASTAAVFHANWQAPDQIAQTVRHILLSPEFRTTWGAKMKRPFETLMGAMRVCGAEITLNPDDNDSESLTWLMEKTGHLPFSWIPPNGFPDTRTTWQGSTPVIMTWHIINWLMQITDAGGHFKLDVLNQTLNAPELADPANHTPRKLAAFWFERSLGYPPDASQIAKAAEMLTHSDEYTGTPWGLDEPIDLSQDEWPHYWQSGLRTLVALILMSPDFLQR